MNKDKMTVGEIDAICKQWKGDPFHIILAAYNLGFSKAQKKYAESGATENSAKKGIRL